MSTITDQTAQILIEKYGAFLSIKELAKTLKRSEGGLRVTLQQNSSTSKKLNSAKTKVGRRVYFNTISIAEIMTEDLDDSLK